MLYKDYDRKGSVAKKKKKITCLESQGFWRQDELIGREPPGVK
jgi:hypothetical protein